MDEQATVRLMKALADRSRLRVLQSLLEGPRYVEELAERLALSPSTVSFHLKKLEQAGLVSGRKEQYYAVYRAEGALLDRSLRQLVTPGDRDRTDESLRLARYHEKVLAAFFENGRLQRMPAQKKKRQVILEAFARELEPGRTYEESELDALVHRWFDDHCLIRRELVDAGLVTRERQRYRRTTPDVPELPVRFPARRSTRKQIVKDDERKRLIKAYKAAERTAGVYLIRNEETSRVLLGSSLNLHGELEKHRFQLEIGSHRCEALQRDWKALGPEAFHFEIVDRVEPGQPSAFETEVALETLEQKWIARLRPFESNCYNTTERIRTCPF